MFLRAGGSSTSLVGGDISETGPLSVCVFGWDAGEWKHFNLLQAAVQAADAAYVYTPSPRGTSEALQQEWLEGCEEAFGVSFETCENVGFVSAQSALAERLEGVDLDGGTTLDRPPPPDLLTGVDGEDAAALVCDFAARWLAAAEKADGGTGERLAVLCPRRTPSALAVVRALTAAGINVEDEQGEIAEPELTVQIQRAILDYQQDRGGLDGLLNLVELLNQHAMSAMAKEATVLREVFPLDPVEVRRVLHEAFAEVQHHDARVLCEAASVARAEVGKPLRRFIRHLEAWPETLPWQEALRRWCEGLARLGISIDALEPLWSQLQGLAVPDPVPAAAFFHYLSTVLAGAAARRPAGAAHRFARVVVTTLEGAAGQSWDGVILLDSNEGEWPLYPPENPFFDDAVRARFNARRLTMELEEDQQRPHHLLTSADRAQLEHFRFLETLENCTGPLAFASLTRDPAEPNRELYPNEWLLRCLVESQPETSQDEALLDRWRRSSRRVVRAVPRLPTGEVTHLREVYQRRRDPGVPFDEHFFNFQALTGPDELPWAEAWSAGGTRHGLETKPATFAIKTGCSGRSRGRDQGSKLGAGRKLDGRQAGTPVGARRAGDFPRTRAPVSARRIGSGCSGTGWQGYAQRRKRRCGICLKRTRSPVGENGRTQPLVGRGVLRKATWASLRCLGSLAEAALGGGQAERWVGVQQNFQAELGNREWAVAPCGHAARRGAPRTAREWRKPFANSSTSGPETVPDTGPLTLAKVQTGKGPGPRRHCSSWREPRARMFHQTRAGIHPSGTAAIFSLVDEDSASMLQPRD